MIVRHWFSGLVLALCGTCCLANGPVAEPTLGRAEPIGSLPVFVSRTSAALPTGVEVASAVDVGGLPQLGQSVLLVSLQSQEHGEPSLLTPNDPHEIQRHLHQAARLLAASGLDDEARRVESILQDFQTKHADRLKLARKRAELARLLDEIEELSARVPEDDQTH